MPKVDELRFLVSPALIGAGKRPFEGVRAHARLRLVRTEAFGSGLVNLTYAPGG